MLEGHEEGGQVWRGGKVVFEVCEEVRGEVVGGEDFVDCVCHGGRVGDGLLGGFLEGCVVGIPIQLLFSI